MADTERLTEKGNSPWVGALIVVVAVAAVYFPAAGFPFYNWDDQETLVANPWLRPVSLEHLRQAWSRAYMSLYVPVTYSFWSGLALVAPHKNGPNPAVFHVANVLLHAGLSVIVYFILRNLLKAHWPSVIAALIFAVHPVQVEPVAWTSGAKDLLSGLFSLLTIYTHLQAGDVDTRKRWGWRGASLLFFSLSLLSKPSAVVVPLILLAIDVILIGRTFRQSMPVLVPYLTLAVPVAAVAKIVQSAGGVVSPPVWQRPSVAGDAILFYARQIIAPIRLMVDYGRSPHWLLAQPWATVSWIGVPGLVAMIYATRRVTPGVSAGLAILGLAVLPVLGFVRFEYQLYSTVADHYLYLALLGPALAVGWLLRGRSRNALALAAALIGVLAARSHLQLRLWSDDRRLFEHNLLHNPTSLAATATLGVLASRENDPAAAAGYFALALEHHPGDSITHFNFANLLLNVGRPADAVEHYQRALASKPNDPRYRGNFGIALVSAGRLPEGIQQLRQAVALNPDNADAHFNLGKALKMAGNPGAGDEFRKALELDPTCERARRELAP